MRSPTSGAPPNRPPEPCGSRPRSTTARRWSCRPWRSSPADIRRAEPRCHSATRRSISSPDSWTWPSAWAGSKTRASWPGASPPFGNCWCAHPSLAGAVSRVGKPEDLQALPFVANTALRQPLDWEFSRHKTERRAVRVRSTLAIDATPAVHAAVLAGAGLAVLPDYLVHADVASGRLRPRAAGMEPTERRHPRRCFRRRGFARAKVSAFLEVLTEKREGSERTGHRPLSAPGSCSEATAEATMKRPRGAPQRLLPSLARRHPVIALLVGEACGRYISPPLHGRSAIHVHHRRAPGGRFAAPPGVEARNGRPASAAGDGRGAARIRALARPLPAGARILLRFLCARRSRLGGSGGGGPPARLAAASPHRAHRA